ncbi:alpha-ketoacid dehydrogenase subunit beta [Cryptosporangium aurantiacum]|uniref:Pyruvate dehydrogenase E1 component beta subunit n=1 Tax=Cryptosporangium aurantiacum TaxID=134849 RepID=A0A1M7KFW2_9ACTN|nr:alpha-ketoacid dehydrogenase subunit beta [Cryptosporangium aurantiacum]SHM64175.1 pyruvate dehydrogenase E1 component beta subunit [Cryptosporangium aurantiacum]
MSATTEAQPSTKTLSVLNALNEALDEALAADERVFLLGEDLADPASGVSHVTSGLSTKHGKHRVLDTPISEAAIAGAAIGAAIDGQLPVAEIMIMDFIGIAVDQIVNLAAKARFTSAGRTPCPITVRTSSFGGLGSGATHSQSLEAWFMHIPGIKVVVPSTPADAKGLLKAAIFDPDPVLFVETNILYGKRGPVPTGDYVVELGKADVKRSGSDVTVVTYGRGVYDALDAAKALEDEGIDVEVLDLRTLVPLDVPAVLESVGRTGRAVVAHYAVEFAGPGAELAARISTDLFGQLRAPVARVGARFRPIPAAKELETAVYPSAERIASAVRATVGYAR